jgi:hypothetical protein
LRKKAYPRAPKVPTNTVAAEFLAAKRAAMKKVLSPSSEKKISKKAEAKPELISPRSPKEVTSDCVTLGIDEAAKAGSVPSNATEPDTAKNIRTL